MSRTVFTAAWMLLLIGFSDVARGFDPIGKGPASSIPSTVLFLTTLTRDRIDFPDASLLEVITFLQRTGDVPAEFGVKLDCSRMPEPDTIRVKLVEKNLSLLQAISLLAEQSGAYLQIEPGKLILLPKKTHPDK